MINRLQTVFMGLSALFFGILYSCNSQSDNLLSIGNNFIDPSTRLTKVDTFGISLSTIIMDSLVTSDSKTALIGYYFDDSTGSISSKSFFQISLPDNYSVETDDIYDSVALVLRHSSYYMGDTNQVFSLSVHRVLDDMEVYDDGYLYNTSSFNYNDIALGTLNYYPYPDRDDEVLIKLNDILGYDLFEKLKNDEDEVSSSDDFLDYFKGLVLIPDNSINKAVIGFGMVDSLLSLRLYCHRVEDELIEFNVDFQVINNSLRFNQIISDKSNTSIENLVEQRHAMSSGSTGNVSYVKGGTGLMTTISFPWLKSLVEINDGSLFRAELVVYPIIGDQNIDFIPEKVSFIRRWKIQYP
ncbi:MAG: DUF4270 domain-containing protein [Chloroflexia bacterium]|nr:DUF4270 domain-containing protein [Chloroflexia bacterium]